MPDEVTPQVAAPEAAAVTTQAPPADNREEVYQRLYGDNQEIKESLKTVATELAAAREAAKPAPLPEPPEGEFVRLIAEGKSVDAEQYIAKRAATLAAQMTDEKIRAMRDELTSSQRAEREISDFVSTLRRENSDVMVLERQITAGIQERLAKANPKTHEDYVKVFKAAAAEEIKSAKDVISQLRAAGKTEAQTTKKEILSTSSVAPNGIANNGDPAQGDTPPDTSTESYLAMRNRRMFQTKGLTVA